MILLYTFMLIFLGIISFLINRRVASLEKKYTRTAAEADKLVLKQTMLRQGNSGNAKLDAAENAKRQFLLGQLVQKRDRLEDKHASWLAFADKFTGMVTRLRDWKGRKLPYTMGVLDVSGALYLIDYFGVGQYINFQNMMQMVTSLMTE
jgi:hypothetical protein